MADTWPDVVKAWVLKVPGLAILAALILCVVLIALFLFTTPSCESRSFFGIASDRTKRAECAQSEKKQAKPEVDELKATAQASNAPAPVVPAKSQPVTQALTPDIEFDAGGREAFRKRYGLNIVEAESALLEETPNSSYGFAYGGSFAETWKDKLDTLTIRATSRSVHFEVQKRADGLIYIVGFMRGDSARQMRDTRSYPEKIRLYSERYKSTDAIVAIPVPAIKSVGQSTIDISSSNYIPVLDLGFQ
nr:hypothetical protein [uncultured Sphingomonas sp.]